MDGLLLSAMFLGNFVVTSYQSVTRATDDSPFITSIGYRTNALGVAVSPDMLCGVNKYCRRNVRLFCDPKKVHYDDAVVVEGIGIKKVFDVMNQRHKNRLDVWVGSPEAEKRFHAKYGKKKLKVWLLRETIQ